MLIYSLREYIDTKLLVTANFGTPLLLPPTPRNKLIGLLSASGIHTQAY